jgi:CubicO group peptidase (beta-lactamase class C family)
MAPMACSRLRSLPLIGLLLPTLCLVSACSVLPEGTGAPPSLRPMLELDQALQALVTDPRHPVVAVAALAIRDGRTVYQHQFGSRHLGGTHSGTATGTGTGATQPADAPLPVTANTLYRVASISKLVVALGVMRLVEAGQLSLDDDVSLRLGWRLRHPQFPDRPISLRLLMSHRSGLSDGGERYVYDGHTPLQEVLSPQGSHFQDGLNWHRGVAPGTAFEYVNLNFGVIATVMERATGERFDRLMQRLVLQPLGLRGGFNPADFPAADVADIATQYRKRRTEGSGAQAREVWDPAGPWVVQADDFRHTPPAPPDGLDGYVIGSNGTLFGPQGRLRLSVPDLGTVMHMLLNRGQHDGQAFLQPSSVEQLSSEQWRYDGQAAHGAPDRDWARSWGLGVQRFTDFSASGRGDRLVEGGGLTGYGHTGDAYGLMGLFVIDPIRRDGLVLILTGPGVDPATFPSRWSAHYRWQEVAATAVHRWALSPPSPR